MKNPFVWALLSCAVFTAAGREAAPEKITVTGKIILVGNVPFVEMLIHDEARGRDWFIEGDDQALFTEIPEGEITVRGFPHEREFAIANSTKKIKRYSLSQVVLDERTAGQPSSRR
jgi:hypothetical protein